PGQPASAKPSAFYLPAVSRIVVAIHGFAEAGDVTDGKQAAEHVVAEALIFLALERRDVVRPHRAIETSLVVGAHAFEHVGWPFVVKDLDKPPPVPRTGRYTNNTPPSPPYLRIRAGRSSVIRVKLPWQNVIPLCSLGTVRSRRSKASGVPRMRGTPRTSSIGGSSGCMQIRTP